MFTVKICGPAPGVTEFLQGESVMTQDLDHGTLIRVVTGTKCEDVMILNYGVEMDLNGEEKLGQNAYIMNEKGKTIQAVYQRVDPPKSSPEAFDMRPGQVGEPA